MAAVREQDLAQFLRYVGAVDGALEAFLDKFRQKTAVVDMGMAQDNRVDFTGIEGELPAVEVPDQFGSLEHAAVQQDFLSIHLQHMTRSCHDFISSEKPDFHTICLPTLKFLKIPFSLYHIL